MQKLSYDFTFYYYVVVEMLYNLDVRQRWEKDATVELIEDQIDYRIIYWLVSDVLLACGNTVTKFTVKL